MKWIWLTRKIHVLRVSVNDNCVLRVSVNDNCVLLHMIQAIRRGSFILTNNWYFIQNLFIMFFSINNRMQFFFSIIATLFLEIVEETKYINK